MNDNREITKAYIQLNAILSVLPDEQKSKIPKDIMDKILNAKLKGYIFRYDYNKDLLKQKLNIPILEEKKKIGRLFSQIDRTITLHDKKIQYLKQLKRGLLQKMFV